jgi:hypothetical protein
MSGVTATTAVIIAAGVAAAAQIATTLMADDPPTGASSLAKLGEWDLKDFGLDLGDGGGADVLEFDSGSEDDNMAPSEGATVGVGGLQEGANPVDDMSLGATQQQTALTTQQTRAAEAPSQAGGMLDFVKDNQLLLGGALKGLGAGISGYMQAESAKEIADRRARADSELLAQRDSQTTAKWAGSTPGMLNPVPRTPNPTPTERFDPPAYRGQYVWDPQQNKFVFVQQPTAAA